MQRVIPEARLQQAQDLPAEHPESRQAQSVCGRFCPRSHARLECCLPGPLPAPSCLSTVQKHAHTRLSFMYMLVGVKTQKWLHGRHETRCHIDPNPNMSTPPNDIMGWLMMQAWISRTSQGMMLTQHHRIRGTTAKGQASACTMQTRHNLASGFHSSRELDEHKPAKIRCLDTLLQHLPGEAAGLSPG